MSDIRPYGEAPGEHRFEAGTAGRFPQPRCSVCGKVWKHSQLLSDLGPCNPRDQATIAEGHTLTLTEQPVEKGPRFTVTCTCGDRFTSDFAVCAQAVPAIHRHDLEAAAC